MIFAGTGHRPNKLFKTDAYSEKSFILLVAFLEICLRSLKPTKVISGMALGFDMALAQAASNLGIPFIAAIPFKGQETAWPAWSYGRKLYPNLLKQASEVVYVCTEGYAAWKMQKRNEWMVDNADAIITLWDGSSGGTGNCLTYAQKKGKTIHNSWSGWVTIKQ